MRFSQSSHASRIEVNTGSLNFVLTPVDLRDATDVCRHLELSKKEICEFLPFFDCQLETRLEKIRRAICAFNSGQGVEWVVRDVGTGNFLCYFYLMPRNLNPNALEIGYWVSSQATGRGIATAVTQTLIVYCFEAVGCDRIQISHAENNHASRRIIEKCGFVFEGKFRNNTKRANPEWNKAGFKASRTGLYYSLIPEDKPQLAWYSLLQNSIQVFDYQGNHSDLVSRGTTSKDY